MNTAGTDMWTTKCELAYDGGLATKPDIHITKRNVHTDSEAWGTVKTIVRPGTATASELRIGGGGEDDETK
jgi:hypothetical protein